MEIIYATDMKINSNEQDFERILLMDISSRNILAFSSTYLCPVNEEKLIVDSSFNKTVLSSFCIYVCALEQPWLVSLIAASIQPISQLVWDSSGKFLLVCHQTGLCRIYEMTNGSINSMTLSYQYEIKEDILLAKYLFSKKPVVITLDNSTSVFSNDHAQWSDIPSGNFICVTTSGTIYTLPLTGHFSPYPYILSQEEAIRASICDIYMLAEGFHLVLSERICGALVELYLVEYSFVDSKVVYRSARHRAFRIPSCYGELQSLVVYQRHDAHCVLTHLRSSTGDLIDFYEFNSDQSEWFSITLINTSPFEISSISVSPSSFYIKDNQYQALFARQILFALNDGSIISFDRLNLTFREQIYPLNKENLFKDPSEYFIRIRHTFSGCCYAGVTRRGVFVVLRTINLDQISSPAMIPVLVHLLEQDVVQSPYPSDIWEILTLVSSSSSSTIVNQIIERFVEDFLRQTLEFQRSHFVRYKQTLFHLHRLMCPMSNDSGEHLISLLIYENLLVVRDYLRLFVYEPVNRNFADAAQEILQQSSFPQNIDVQRIKFLPNQTIERNRWTVQSNEFQSISFITMINWISDLLFYFIAYLRLQQMPQWLPLKTIFHDPQQLQWLRELILYFYILNKMDKISSSKIAQLQTSNKQQDQNEMLKDIYQALTKFSQRLEVHAEDLFDESILDGFSVYDIEKFESKIDSFLPKSYLFLQPNLSAPQTFIRDEIPTYIDRLYGTIVSLHSSSMDEGISTPTKDERLDQIKFDIISLGKISLASNTTFRRCLRCGNFSRLFSNKPYPFLVYYLNDQCLCGGLFLQYTKSS